MKFVTLTRENGAPVFVNVAQIVMVRDRKAESANTVIVLSNGGDFEVQEEYQAVVDMLER